MVVIRRGNDDRVEVLEVFVELPVIAVLLPAPGAAARLVDLRLSFAEVAGVRVAERHDLDAEAQELAEVILAFAGRADHGDAQFGIRRL